MIKPLCRGTWFKLGSQQRYLCYYKEATGQLNRSAKKCPECGNEIKADDIGEVEVFQAYMIKKKIFKV